MNNLIITEDQVLNILTKLDKNKAYGIDAIPTIIYKYCALALYKSLTLLYNVSLYTGILPNEWKTAAICPILKKGNPEEIVNYRPISLLPIAIKVMEKCVHNYIYPTIQTTLDTKQHGFRASKSTTTQLLSFYDTVHKNLDNNIQTDIIYLDLAKAFDKVSHELLLIKLQKYGFNGKLLTWFHQYLNNRRQCVLVNGVTSNYARVYSGVPQGSILGPLLFIIFVDDMIASVSQNSTIYLYADDSKLSCPVHNIRDCDALQNDLKLLFDWSKTWGLKFNVNKCQVMTVTRARIPIVYNYFIDNVGLARVNSCMDLGLNVSNTLNWDNHLKECIKKANRRLGLIKRILCPGVTTQVKLTAYTALVRPLLEYGSLIWSQASKNNINMLEAFQRRASKFITNNYNIGYKERLLACNLMPLSYRREIMDIVFYYNCINGIVEFDTEIIAKKPTACNRMQSTRSQKCDKDLPIRYTRTVKYSNFYTNRIVLLWNSLPRDIKDMDLSENDSNSRFKNELRLLYYNKFLYSFSNDNTCTWISNCKCVNCRIT